MIRTESLTVVYPSAARARDAARALVPTSIAFGTGAFTVLLGASGAGKSTLLRALNGLVRPTGGSVIVEGIGTLATSAAMRAHRRRTGMVFQQHQLIGRSSVLRNVLLGRLGYHGSLRTLLPFSVQEKQLALDGIERVGLIDHALRRADQLSGGQQQRVGIARTLVQEPTLILADEPVASLDPASADRVLNLLHTICKEDGITAIVSLHQLEFAKRYADRIVGLAQGQIVFDGTPDELGKPEIARIYGAYDLARPEGAGVKDVAAGSAYLKTGTDPC